MGERRKVRSCMRDWAPRAALAAVVALAFLVAPAAGQVKRAEWCPEPEARQFDFWLGEWDVQNRNSRPGADRWAATGRATNRVYTVVGGCAVVEHWRGWAWPGAGHIVGFSVRAWDPAAGQWELVLLWPMGPPQRFGNPEGRFEDGRGDFYSRFTTPQGDSGISRLSFWKIEPGSFQWNNAMSLDGGTTWDSTWIMHQRRRPRTAPGLPNGPAMTTDRCPAEAHRLFDRWLGDWTGARVIDGDSIGTRTHLIRILEGCAVMERTRAEDGSWAAFRVRAYEPASGWVEYAVASDRRMLHRREATVTGEAVVFTDAEPVDGTYHRTRWRADQTGIHRVEQAASGPEGPWRTVWEAVFPVRVSGASGPTGSG